MRDSLGRYVRGHRDNIKHGLTHTKTYASWSAMHHRVNNPRHSDFAHYGARGITICKRWSSFENFYKDMVERPEGRTLDRIDVDGNYEPSNCRWATASEQRRNMRLQPPRTHCKRGHPWVESNIRPVVVRGIQTHICLACKRQRYHEKKVAV